MPPRIRRGRPIQARSVRPVRREAKVKWYDYVYVGGFIIVALFVAKYLGLPRLDKIFTTYNDATYADFISFLVIGAVPCTIILLLFGNGKIKIMQEQVQKHLQGRRQWLRKFRIWSIQLSDILDKLQRLPSVFVYLHTGAVYFFFIHLVFLSLEVSYYYVMAMDTSEFGYNFAVEVVYFVAYVRGGYALHKLFAHFSYFIMRLGGIIYKFLPEYLAIAFNCIHFGFALLLLQLAIKMLLYTEKIVTQTFMN